MRPNRSSILAGLIVTGTAAFTTTAALASVLPEPDSLSVS